MKYPIVLLTVLFSMCSLTNCNKEKLLDEKDIPAEIKQYAATHFPSCVITKATKETGNRDDVYEINLSCGVKLEFNLQKNIVDIDGSSKLPDSVIPTGILNYVAANYAGKYIVGWEIQNSKQYADLSNRVTLVFDMQDSFLYIAD